MTLDPRQAARDAVRRIWNGNTPLDTLADVAVDAYLSTAPSGQAPLEGVNIDMIAETIWRSEWRRAGNGGERRVPWSEIAEKDQERYRFLARDVAALLPARAEPVAWQRYSERMGWTAVDAAHAKELAASGEIVRPLYASPPASGAVEAGWQLVPKEPTPEMVSAAMGEIPEDGSEYDDIEDAWRAMLAAAPTEGR